MANITEYTMSAGEDRRPIVLTGHKAIGTLLYQLCLLKPGNNPELPEMGVDIRRWLGRDEDSLIELRRRISDQINLYLPQFQGVEVGVSLKGGILTVAFNIDGTLYTFDMDEAGNLRTVNQMIE